MVHLRSLALKAALPLTLLVACVRSSPPPVPPPLPQSAPAVPISAATVPARTPTPIASSRSVETPYASAPIADAELEQAIASRFARDPLLAGQKIDVQVLDADVRLLGDVSTLAAKWRASQIADELGGVDALTDELIVRAPARRDAEIARDVRGALDADPATRGVHAEVSVRFGSVLLDGVADSSTQRELLRDAAGRIPGVEDVRLDVLVEPYSARGDAEIAADVRDRLADDARLDGDRVSADVRGRRVTVTGMVGSLTQREAAEDDAWLSGVGAVDATGVRIDHRAQVARRTTAIAPTPATDAHLQGAVERAVLEDPRVAGQIPKVAVQDGRVTLAGAVADFRAARAAVDDARRVRGVGDVRNDMEVRPARPGDDAMIERRVERTVYNEAQAPDATAVRIMTSNGRVVLRGHVGSPDEKRILALDAEEVPGVVAVEDDLRVDGVARPNPASSKR